MYSTFGLASGLFSRGHGILAEKSNSKGLPLLEHGVEDNSPVVIWNLIDMIYEMVVQAQITLLQLFLGHFATSRTAAAALGPSIGPDIERC